MIAVQRQEVAVVPSESKVTVVGAYPKQVVVTEISDNVAVVTAPVQMTVVTQPATAAVIPIKRPVTVVAGAQQVGPKIFFGPTPPSGAKLNDIWIRTA